MSTSFSLTSAQWPLPLAFLFVCVNLDGERQTSSGRRSPKTRPQNEQATLSVPCLSHHPPPKKPCFSPDEGRHDRATSDFLLSESPSHPFRHHLHLCFACFVFFPPPRGVPPSLERRSPGPLPNLSSCLADALAVPRSPGSLRPYPKLYIIEIPFLMFVT